MDLSQIRELLKIVADSGVAEVEIEEEDFKLVVRLNAPNVSIQHAAPYQQPPYPVHYPPPPQPAPVVQQIVPQQPVQAAPAAPPAAAAEPESAAPPVSANEHVIKAPIVGTFYRSPSPDTDPFVQVGDTVNPKDVLCIIEAMKLMNEIECEVSGTIKEILISNAEPVEYDQPLFIIEKS